LRTSEHLWPQVYRASPLWTINLVAGPIVGIVGFTSTAAWNSLHGDAPPTWLLSYVGVFAIAFLLAYFPGNLAVLWPYAVSVDPRAGVQLSGPMKKVLIPISEIGEIEDSFFWQGSMVHLLKPRVALTQFVIPWYFGSERKALIDSIQFAVRSAGS
jgi:hypothetical protein